MASGSRNLAFPKLKIIGLHLLFWILVVTYFAWGFGFDTDPLQAFMNPLLFLPGQVFIVYTLLYFLVPKFLLKQKFWAFFAGLLISIVICGLYTALAQLSINSIGVFQGATITIGRNVLPYVHVAAIAASIKLLKYWYVQRKETIQAEQQRTVAELKLLKAQLHPHFLFNTLNNLYSHTLENSHRSPEIVLKLSNLLRFMIYESNVAKIPLTKEIELLRNYISLEQLRYGERLDMSVSIMGNVGGYQIAPLLLLPFLENAFKHGTSQQIDQCWIRLDLAIKEDTMYFKLVNSVDPALSKSSKVGGLGLSNVKRRLDLLYKDNYNFDTSMQEEVFIVSLNIKLEELQAEFVEKLALT